MSEAVEPQGPPPIETWSSQELTKWRQTGETPMPKKAESAPAQDSSDDAEPVEAASEPAPESETGVKQEPAQPKKAGAEARKQELAREIQDLLRQRAELRSELERSTKPAEKTAESAPAKTQQPAGKPSPENFKTYEDFIDALTDWRVEQREQAKAAAQAQAKREADEKDAIEKWDSRVAEISKVHADYNDVVMAANIPVSKDFKEAILTSEHGPEILYHLAKNLDEAKRIAALPTIAAVRELGKLEAKFAKPPAAAAPEPKVTRASKPVTELAAKATAPADEAEAALKDGDFARYKRVMNSRSLAA